MRLLPRPPAKGGVTPASVAAVLGALEVLEEEPERLKHLWDNAHYMKQGLEDLGFDTGQSESPIIPVFLGDLERCFQVWQFIQKAGICPFRMTAS